MATRDSTIQQLEHDLYDAYGRARTMPGPRPKGALVDGKEAGYLEQLKKTEDDAVQSLEALRAAGDEGWEELRRRAETMVQKLRELVELGGEGEGRAVPPERPSARQLA